VEISRGARSSRRGWPGAGAFSRSRVQPALGDGQAPDVRAAVDEAAFVRDARNRVRSRIAAPDRRSGLLTGGSFVVVTTAWLMLSPPAGLSIAAFIACVIVHMAASSVEFEIGPGSALPTTPVLVVALFTLPPQVVPLVAVAGLVGTATIARLRDRSRREQVMVLAGSGWHAVGAASVFAIAGVTRPELGQWGILGLALAAQFLLDAASSWVRNCYGLGVPTRQLIGALRFTFLADLLLAPIGLTAAIAAPGSTAALLFLVPPILLLAMLQRDRRTQINRTVTLGDAVAEASDRARRDVLTGLPNRLAWEEAIASQANAATPLAVILADVDGLKAANDTFGHDTGDALLVAVGGAVADAMPNGENAVCARLGGDEFGILLAGDLAQHAEQVVEVIRLSLATAYPVNGSVPVSASVGLGSATSGDGLATALTAADRAVYEDKRRRGVHRR
jgi:diguanylate cyclase (GGDEF)-like protein